MRYQRGLMVASAVAVLAVAPGCCTNLFEMDEEGNISLAEPAATVASWICGHGEIDDPPAGGDPNGGDPNGGDPNGGDPNGGDPNGGDPNGGDPNGGDPNGGDSSFYDDFIGDGPIDDGVFGSQG